MAADLAGTPDRRASTVQLCGDAHLSNFGVFGSPERNLIFDVNDFDETLPGPFEYDVKRLAASITIAGRNNGFSAADVAGRDRRERRRPTGTTMARFAAMSTLDVWYAHVSEQDIIAATDRPSQSANGARRRRRCAGGSEPWPRRRAPVTASRRSRSWPSPSTGGYRIVSQPPIVVPIRDVQAAFGLDRGRDPARAARPVPRLPPHAAGRPAAPPGAVRARRHRPQGRRRRERRHPRVHPAAPGPRLRRPAVPPGEGGDGVGPRGPPAEEPVPAAR